MKNTKYLLKSNFSALGVDRDLGFSQGPQTHLFPLFWILSTPLIPQKFPRNPPKSLPKPPKSLRNPQNLKKSNFSALGLGRDLRFSRVLQSHKSPYSEYYPHLCPPKKSPSHHICWFCINFMWNDNLTLIVLLFIVIFNDDFVNFKDSTVSFKF